MGDEMCFGCSPDNPIGLQLNCWSEGETTYTEFNPTNVHQSYNGVFHGGLIITIMDELIGHHLMDRGYRAVTGRMNARFKKPVPIKNNIRFGCYTEKQKGNLFVIKAWTTMPEGETVVEAEAHMMRID